MCPHCSYFSTYKKLGIPKHIWVADNWTIDAIGIGDIEVNLFLDGKSHSGTLKDMLHLPSLSEPLLSTTQMNDSGTTIILMSNQADLVNTKTGKVFTRANHHSRLYKLQVKIRSTQHAHAAQGHPSSKASLSLWHRRLGHISEDTI